MKTLYRILSPVFCIAAIPIAIFMPAIRLVITSSLCANIMSTFGIKEYTSIFDLIKMISTADESSSQLFKVIYQIFTAEDSKIADMLTTTPWLIAAAVLLVIILIAMIVSAVLGALGKSGVCTIITGASAVLAIAMNKCFDAFAKPFVSGQIGLKSLLSTDSETVLSQLIGNAANVACLELSFMYQALMLLCAATAIFSLFAYFDKKYN